MLISFQIHAMYNCKLSDNERGYNISNFIFACKYAKFLESHIDGKTFYE